MDKPEFGYIAIGNFQTKPNGSLETGFNVASGVTDFSFLVLMKEYAQENDLTVVFQSNDTLVIRGTRCQMRALQAMNGPRFSYYYTDSDGLGDIMDAEEAEAKSVPLAPSHLSVPQGAYLDA